MRQFFFGMAQVYLSFWCDNFQPFGSKYKTGGMKSLCPIDHFIACVACLLCRSGVRTSGNVWLSFVYTHISLLLCSHKRDTEKRITKHMYVEVLKSKIHRVTITEANLDYVGSITIDEDLMDAANIIAGEKVQIVDNTNGARLETYTIPGRRGSGVICLNGAAARIVQPGDVIIIMAYAWMPFEEAKAFKPCVVFPDTVTNKIIDQ